ncbi:DUF6427 family protein [Porphyromonas circumdentaria]|uniref:DUF6427 family protein n=1 Tax=Porphyromonas circumdentaria TaxID=29524 RepID=UPI0026DDA589|nr:DUF6427 family protein [Porphyromonas circumdentaria]MDO4722336.1 DUF6427 family protein [Porphyromonas circumdentaria]
MKRHSIFSKKRPYDYSLLWIVLLFLAFLLFARSAYPLPDGEESYFLDLHRFLPPSFAPIASFFLFIMGVIVVRVTSNVYVLNDESERSKSTLLSLLLLFLFPCSLGSNPAFSALPFWGMAHHTLYASYREKSAPFEITNCAIALSLATIVWPPSILLLPIMIFNIIDLQAFSWRNLLAFFFGYIAPLILLALIAVMTGWSEDLLLSLQAMMRLEIIGYSTVSCGISLLMGGGVLVLLYLWAIGGAMMHLSKKKVKVLQLTATLMRTLFLLLGGVLFVQHLEGFLLLMILPTAMLLSGVIQRKKPFQILLILLMIILLVIWGSAYNFYSF